MNVALAVTIHDPGARMAEQTIRTLPLLTKLFSHIAVQATHATDERTLDLLRNVGAHIRQEQPERFAGYMKLGRPRRDAVELALHADEPFVLFCDFDRVIHWAELYPAELAAVVAQLPEYDCTVLGRTARAFASHPRVQRDTEALSNHVFALATGLPWDITAAARGLSRRAAATILAECADESIGTDASWPLFVRQTADLSIGYLATEGLEFETADRFADQVAAAGGVESWIAQIDNDPAQWSQRLEIAFRTVDAMLPYQTKQREDKS